jgi:hypothetical protein
VTQKEFYPIDKRASAIKLFYLLAYSSSWPYPHIIDQAGNAFQVETLWLITKICKLWTKKFYNAGTWQNSQRPDFSHSVVRYRTNAADNLFRNLQNCFTVIYARKKITRRCIMEQPILLPFKVGRFCCHVGPNRAHLTHKTSMRPLLRIVTAALLSV